MKPTLNYLLLSLLGCLFPALLLGQSPQSVTYQAVVRDGNALISDQLIAVEFSILQNGTVVYQETHAPTTNTYGLFTAVIGDGAILMGDFGSIDWAESDYELKVRVDTGGGYEDMGQNTLHSVPYALYSQKAHELDSLPYQAGNGVQINGSTIENTAPDQVVSLSGNGATNVSGSYPNFTISSTDAVNDADADPNNEIQSLSLSGTNLSLSNGGGSVTLPSSPSYSGGSGISITGNVIANTGDTDASDDITTSTSAAGDLGGTYPNPIVNGLRGRNVASTAPSTGQVYKWNGTAWAPADDNTGSSLWSSSGSNIHFNSGRVGIGTSSPAADLEINTNGTLSDPQILLHEDGNDYARLNFDNNNGSNYWSIAAYVASNVQNDRLNFWNGTTGDVMSLTGDGQLGLGVGISPKTELHVGNDRRVLFGTDTLGPGDKLMWLPDLHAFRVGTVSTGAASTYWNRDSIGLYSFASGLNTRAQGYGSTAMGRDTEATSSYAFASGYFTNADGTYSTAMGFNSDALGLGSTALGYSTDATGNYSTTLGFNTRAQSIYSTAIGRYNVGGGSATAWNANDPIFEIGIGTGAASRANAVTVRKNGNVGIGTTVPQDALHVNGRVRFQTVEYFEDGGTSEIAAR
ncbi:MAG: hypothetical protein AAFQ68_18735, partial [Bacteroidota bacterium]